MSMVTKFTVKRAEISVAIILALCSAALMMKSAEIELLGAQKKIWEQASFPFIYPWEC